MWWKEGDVTRVRPLGTANEVEKGERNHEYNSQ